MNKHEFMKHVDNCEKCIALESRKDLEPSDIFKAQFEHYNDFEKDKVDAMLDAMMRN